MAADVMMAEPLPDLSYRQTVDPDAQATVSDFVDYTELFPSDLIRSLTLIDKLDQTYRDAAARVHDLTRTFGNLPTLPANERPDPQTLRTDISLALDRAIASREAALAEASRLVDTAERHSNRLATIKRKLKELPRPPSRDPTPVISPQLARSRKQENEKKNRFGVHIEGVGSGMLKSQKQGKILIPGEVLPPGEELLYNAIGSGDDVESSREASPVIDGLDDMDHPHEEARRSRPPKVPRTPKIRVQKTLRTPADPDRPRGPGRTVSAGVSTSVALRLLTPPPPDAPPGSRWQPWLELTKYELASLRKLMKKHAEWRPSETMIRRELARTGRGIDGYQRAKAAAEAKGETVLDETPIDHRKPEVASIESIPEKIVSVPSEDSAKDVVPDDSKKQRKEKKEIDMEIDKTEQEQEKEKEIEEGEKERETLSKATTLEEANKRIAASSEVIQNLFGRRSSTIMALEPPKTTRKRKREISKELTPVSVKSFSAVEPDSQVPFNVPKRLKLSSPKPTPPALPSATFTASSALSPVRNDIIIATEETSPIANGVVPFPTTGKSPKESHSSPQATAGAVIEEVEKPIPPPVLQSTAAHSRPKRMTASQKSSPKVAAVEFPVEEPPAKGVKTPDHQVLRPRSTRASLAPPSVKAASAEPPASKREIRQLRDTRRSSVVEVSQLPETPKAPEPEPNMTTGRVTRRSKKPAPGIITEDEGGKGKVSVTARRQNAPRKRAAAPATPAATTSTVTTSRKEENANAKVASKENERPVTEEPEEVDPNEPRYCICNDVSYGTMIACENEECEKEWFHLPCVNRTEIPPRRQKWYCPDCRVLLQVDELGKTLPTLAAARADAKQSRTPVLGPNYSLSVSERVKRGRRQSDDNNQLVGA